VLLPQRQLTRHPVPPKAAATFHLPKERAGISAELFGNTTDDWDDVTMTDWPAWATEKVEVRPPDVAWQERGDKERLLLEAALGAWLVAPIEHVGSTAVPNLTAKPILGLQGLVTNLDCAADIATALAPAGWHYVPPELDARAWRRFLVKVAQGRRGRTPARDVRSATLAGVSRWPFVTRCAPTQVSSSVTQPSRKRSRRNTSTTVRLTPRARQTSLPLSSGRVAMTP
jgi:GrpB protein